MIVLLTAQESSDWVQTDWTDIVVCSELSLTPQAAACRAGMKYLCWFWLYRGRWCGRVWGLTEQWRARAQCRLWAGGDETSCSVSSPFPSQGILQTTLSQTVNTVNTVNTAREVSKVTTTNIVQWRIFLFFSETLREEVRKIVMFTVVREEEGLTGGLSPSWHQGTHTTHWLWLQWKITNIIRWRTQPPHPASNP